MVRMVGWFVECDDGKAFPNESKTLTLAVMAGLQRSLNDVGFENYHVFRSEMRIVP